LQDMRSQAGEEDEGGSTKLSLFDATTLKSKHDCRITCSLPTCTYS
jgi:hypothetical protein